VRAHPAKNAFVLGALDKIPPLEHHTEVVLEQCTIGIGLDSYLRRSKSSRNYANASGGFLLSKGKRSLGW
jgi:hypothetical protein